MTGALVPVTGSAMARDPSSSVDANRARGICTIKTDSGKTFRFRTNPNSIRWKYVLNTNVEDTYGGRVIQILSARITTLNVQVEAGWGGWPYVVKVAYFLRDLMNEQRNGKPATFEYTTRNWKLKCFAASIPFTDSVGKPNRKIDMSFNVVEDTSGALTSSTIGAELNALKEGIGYKRNQYNSSDTSEYSDSPTAAISLLEGNLRNLQSTFGSLSDLFTGGNAAGPTTGLNG